MRGQIELAAEEEDASVVVFEAAEAASVGLDRLDLQSATGNVGRVENFFRPSPRSAPRRSSRASPRAAAFDQALRAVPVQAQQIVRLGSDRDATTTATANASS